ncbi:DUF418 domain-containing protein [Erythrobacter litoralis]|uniref:DUF418 domain-containing protein n=1 Tax=Erythrobacter litoralis TaxID=39960 RepID=UPI00243520D0|nr:DUF418 domain-containing protein [Erythrobacter litoralis]
MTTYTDEAAAAVDQPEPVAVAGNRIGSLDFIRGIAVMGILAANIVAFGQPFQAYMFPGAFTTPHGEAENWMWVAQFVAIDGKMRGLFSLLFGAGLYLFMEKAWERGAGRGLQARRLLFLGIFGLIHFFLIWRGDILFLYACAGLAALLFIRLSAKRQMVLGVVGYIGGAILYGIFTIPLQFVADTPQDDAPAAVVEMREGLEKGKRVDLADAAVEDRLHETGSYADIVSHRASEHWDDLAATLFLFAFETLPLMLIGMALYRFGLFDGRMDRRKVLLWGWAGLIVGGALTLWIAIATKNAGLTYYGTLAAFSGWSPIPRLLMTLGLAALLALWGARASGWLAERVSAAGRAAFTNYLGTSVVMMLVFDGWAGGLFGDLTRGQLYLVVLAAWALMLAWSNSWLARYRYGPLEWLWRCLTYGKRFALRR